MNNIKWNRLLKALKNKGTVLFIGPDVEKDEKGDAVFPSFCQKMLNDYEGEVEIDKDGFFFFVEPEAKSDVEYDMKEYYEKHDFGIDLYRKIAAIPFHLIISLSPDDSIHNVFSDNGVKHQFAYYTPYKTEIEEPTSEKPLIYNLLGLATQKKYILTQEDYFDYLKAILGDDVFPRKIISELRDASNFIFLGFDFDKWYNRLILMILNFHIDKEGKTRHAIQTEKCSDLLNKLVEKQFNITFVKNHETDFIQTFSEKVEEAGMLRTLIPLEEALKQQIAEKQQLLADYETKMTLSDVPKEIMCCEKEIEQLKKEIEVLTQKLKNI